MVVPSSMCCVLQDGEEEGKEEFAIVFAAMGVNMETAHYFKQVLLSVSAFVILFLEQRRLKLENLQAKP